MLYWIYSTCGDFSLGLTGVKGFLLSNKNGFLLGLLVSWFAVACSICCSTSRLNSFLASGSVEWSRCSARTNVGSSSFSTEGAGNVDA